MSLTDHNRIYLSLAFCAGILLTLGYKDLYPDLERRFRRALHSRKYTTPLPPHSTEHISLEDHSRSISGPSGSDAKRTNNAPLTQPPPPCTYEIRDGIEGTIGNTPLIRIKSLSEYTGCEILAKAEFLNGAGNSPKDRVALSMIKMAEEEGLLVPGREGDTIYEGTVGSTGISLAAIARARGYKAYICMPSDVATEKSDLLLNLGATVERVQPASIVDSNQFVNVARARAAAHTADPDVPGAGFFADQFENSANYLAHYQWTGPEILSQTSSDLDAFISGAGTGGTISGTALYLKSALPSVRVILADPQGSGLYNKVKHGVMFSPTEREGTRRRHQVDSIVEGVGINRLTANFAAGAECVDDAVRVSDGEAMRMGRWLVERDGLFVGSSSCVNAVAAVRVALSEEMGFGRGCGKRIVTVLCDSGVRGLSKFWKEAGKVGGADEMTMEMVLGVGGEE